MNGRKGEKITIYTFLRSHILCKILSWEKSYKVVKLHEAIWHQSKFKKVLRVKIKLDLEILFQK